MRKTLERGFWVLLLLILWGPLYAEEPSKPPPITTAAKQIVMGGQGRIRYQSFPAPSAEEDDFFTNYRFRLNVDVALTEGISLFLQPQKVGVLGNGETGASVDVAQTLVQVDPATGAGPGAGNITLHQAYLQFNQIGGLPVNLRLGRFEYILVGHRLVGNFDWSQRARSFDGVSVSYGFPNNGTLSLFGFRLSGEREAGPLPAGDRDADTDLLGAHFGTALLPMSLTELVFLNDRKLPGLSDSSRYTAGAKIERVPAIPPLAFVSPLTGPVWRGEYYKQWGDRSATQEIDAFLYAIRLGYRFDLFLKPMFLIGWEVLSGDDDLVGGDFEVFDTLYPTNHIYYGYMDYFISIPVDTRGGGLQDRFVRIHLTPWERAGWAVDLHSFSLDKEVEGEKTLGIEADLTLFVQMNPFTSLMLGYSRFFGKGGMEVLGRILPDEDPTWAYTMVNVIF